MAGCVGSLPSLAVVLYGNPLLRSWWAESLYSILCCALYCSYPSLIILAASATSSTTTPSQQRQLEPVEMLARVFLLQPVVQLASAWPQLLRGSTLARLPAFITGESGPFGAGGYKLIELAAALVLGWPWITTRLGSLPGPVATGAIACGCVMVAGVLWVWSELTRSRGTHHGVTAMADRATASNHGDGGKIGLSASQHLVFASFALGNALCEEVVSRGLFLGGLATQHGPPALPVMLREGETTAGWLATLSSFVWASFMWPPNLWQAAGFGCAHYYGVPSGVLGVVLTFVYGLLMGTLYVWCGGLIVPVLAHTAADYFIFAVIARKHFAEKDE
jgi:membrane protease YdiL (CAAX protease family)